MSLSRDVERAKSEEGSPGSILSQSLKYKRNEDVLVALVSADDGNLGVESLGRKLLRLTGKEDSVRTGEEGQRDRSVREDPSKGSASTVSLVMAAIERRDSLVAARSLS